MTRNKFIFSNRLSHRITRHLIFWLVYSIYFYIQSFAPDNNNSFFDLHAYKNALVHSLCFIPACVFSVYISINFLFPYLLRRKYAAFIAGFLFLCVVDTFINYLFIHSLYKHLLPVDVLKENTFLAQLQWGYYNAYKAFVITGLVIGIVLVKNWYLQQKENLEITRKTTETEVHEQKARINPKFILRSLHSIHQKIIAAANDSPAMILRLSNLLSYSLYESNLNCVSLEKEVLHLQRFVALEQISPENFTDIRLEIKGINANRYIVPLTLLSVIQNALTIINYDDFQSNLMVVKLTIQNKSLSLKLTCNYLKSNNDNFFDASFIKKIDNNFNNLHGVASCEIQMNEQNQQLIIILNIPLLLDPLFVPSSSSLKATSPFYESA